MAAFRKIRKPGKDEYPGYSHIYMDLLKDDDLILDHLHENFFKIKEFIYSLPVEKLIYRYAENKWTIKEILVHVIDAERIFACGALRYARNDNTPVRGFEQDDYAKCSYAGIQRKIIHTLSSFIGKHASEWRIICDAKKFNYILIDSGAPNN